MSVRHSILWALSALLALAAASMLSPLYTLPDQGLRVFLLLAAAAAVARLLAGRGPGPEPDTLTSGVITASALVLAWLLPAPWKPGMLLLAAGAGLQLMRSGGVRSLGASLVFTGAAVSVGHILVLPASYLHAMLPADLPTGWVASLLARGAGFQAAVLGPEWVLATPDESLFFSLGPEWTGLWYRVVIVGVFVLLWLGSVIRAERRSALLGAGVVRLGLLLGASVLWGGLVFCFQSQLAVMRYEFELPWNPLYQVAVAVPLALLAGLLVPHGQARAVSAVEGPRRRSLALGLLALVCFWLAVHLELPLGDKPGRVLVDDSHSDWEWTGDPMNTTQFGTRTTYNYHGLARLLERHYDSRVNFDPLTASLLESVDVLILKTPTRAYEPAEIEAVLDFVREGGGLYLISDHTDVFGMSTFLNEITRHFGFEYNKDTVFDLLSTEDQFWQQTDIVPHPAFQHLPWYRYLTGCSIRPGWNTRLVAAGPQAGSDLLSYATSNFFDVYYPRTEMRWGNLFQVVATRYGKGKVLGFSDSTTYSNFAMFLEGRLEHLLGIVAWLNSRALPVDERWILGLLALVAGVAALRGRGLRVHHGLALAVLSAALVIPAVRALNGAVHTLPERRHVLPGIVVDTGLSRIDLPGRSKLDHEARFNMETFMVWLYRSGSIPERASQQLFPGTEQYILLNPTAAPEPAFRQELHRFMEQGGRVLVAAQPGVDCGNTNEWLAPYGLALGTRTARDARVVGAGTRMPVYFDQVRDVQGGTPVYTDGRGLVLASEVAVGRGGLLVSGLAEGFNNAHLGRYDSVPSELAYEYLQIYYRHTGMSGTGVEASAGPPGLKP
jgi:hypothetical protein